MILDRQFLIIPTSKPFYGRGRAYDISTQERSFVQERDGARRLRASRKDLASTNNLELTKDCVSTIDHVLDRDSKSAKDCVSEKSLWTMKRVCGPLKETEDHKRVYRL